MRTSIHKGDAMITRFLCVLIITLISTSAYGATSTSIEIKEGADKLNSALESIPYVSEGSGPVLYIFQYPRCKHCKKIHRAYRKGIPGVEARYVIFGFDRWSNNRTAAMAKRRDVRFYHAMMGGGVNALDYKKKKKLRAAFHSVMDPINQTIVPTLVKNGWKSKGLVAPTYIWEKGGTWHADTGPDKAHFDALLAGLWPEDFKQQQVAKKEAQQAKKIAQQTPPSRANDGAPIQSTEVQGIKLGMPVKEATAILQSKGYLGSRLGYSKTDEQSHRTLNITAGNYTKDGKVEPAFIKSINYKQQYKQEIKFPLEGLKEAVLKKYGPPLNGVQQNKAFGDKGAYSFRYYPPQPDRNIIQNECSKEMNERGVKLDRMGIGSLHPMQQRVFRELGEREIKAKCPSQLEAHRKLIEFEWGIWASISIDPRSKTVVIDIQDHGPEQWKWRWIHEEKLQKQDSGPTGKVDF